MRLALVSSCWTSICRRSMAMRFWRVSRQTPLANDSGNCLDQFRGGIRCPEKLPTDGELVSQKNGGLERVRDAGKKPQRLLANKG
jgi:hypothetical protein